MTPPAKLSDLNAVFATFLNGALIIVGILSIIMIVIGGISYVGSGGDKEGTAKARNTITFAIIGLILAISTWMILNIFGTVIGVDLTNFSVCFTSGCN